MTDLQHAETCESTTTWARRCRRMSLIYGVAVFIVQLPLILGLSLLSFWLLNVAGPLLRGDVAFSHPAYEYLQSSKDLLVAAFGVLTALLALSWVLLHHWWKRSTAALGPMPAELRPKTFKAWNRQRRIMKVTYLAAGAVLLWILVLAVLKVVSGVQAYEAWSALGEVGFDDPGYDEVHSLLDLSIALGGVGAIAFCILSVSCWRSYGRAQQLLGPEPARVTIRELDEFNVNQWD